MRLTLARRLRAALLVPLMLTTFLTISSPAHAAEGERYEQYRFAVETINLSYERYVQRQAEFRAAGCTNKWPDTALGCKKPAPYNQFDWTDDGCSGAEFAWGAGRPISVVYRDLFNQPCRLHDFGYRNLGNGLALYRHEDMRNEIDRRFLVEMRRVCDNTFQGWRKAANRVQCHNQAVAVFTTVATYNRIFKNWGRTATPPAAPRPATVFNLKASVSSDKTVTVTLRAANLQSSNQQSESPSAFVYYTCTTPDGRELDHPKWWIIDDDLISGTPADGTWRVQMQFDNLTGVRCVPSLSLWGTDGIEVSYPSDQLQRFTGAPFSL